MKKLLYITHLSGRRVNRFWLSSIKAAQELGYEFHLACNMNEAEHPIWEQECNQYQIVTHQIDFNRNPLSPENIHAARQLTNLLKEEYFDIIHCNTPVGGLIGRICARRAKVNKVIYQAHGFHFWKGAPWINWLVYFPVEKCLAHITDVLVTINKEDYQRSKCFKAKDKAFVPGVGIDTDYFCEHTEQNVRLREELGIPTNAVVLLSAGELIKRKNHRVVIESVKDLANTWYVICGQGPLYKVYKELSEKLGIADRVILTGYMTDVRDYYNMADLFVLPSYQEGLPVSLLEAMACGRPCIVSDIRGNVDLVENEMLRFPPDKKERLTEILTMLIADKNRQHIEGIRNRDKALQYSYEIIVSELKKIYVT